MKTILVCGGRDYADQNKVFKTLTGLCNFSSNNPFGDPVIIVHGGARGADQLAGIWATINHKTCHVYKADWEKHGKAAGAIRNQEMLTKETVDLVVAFPGGRGTSDMMWRARKAGIEVMEIAGGKTTADAPPQPERKGL